MMIKLHLVLGMIMLVLGLFAAAPRQERATRPSQPEIERLQLFENGEPDAPLFLELRGSQSHNCDVTWRTQIKYFPENVDIHLFHEIPLNAPCAEFETAFELTLAIELEAAPRYILVNERVWREEREDARVAAPQYNQLTLMPAVINKAMLSDGDHGNRQRRLRIQGRQAVGCDLPELYSLRQTGESVKLGVYNAMPADTACPDMLISLDEIIRLPATDLPADTLLLVNTYPIGAVEELAVSESDKVLTNIFRVDVKVNEMRISLDVKGEHPDGCEYPVIVDQTRRGNIVDVEVYREVPADVICPMILKPYSDTIKLAGDFETGEYTINVNSHSQAVNI